ncbi:MAG TPA: hypothetical protein VM555_07890, partial [Tahibacter sp.]|nr:hypothetical protein [Tahibacter sp.]
MTSFRSLTFCWLLLSSIGAAHAAGDARAELVVDAPWLVQHVDDPGLVLLHVGDKDEYAQGHIAGARLVALDDISVSAHTRDGLMLELPAADDLHARLQKLGISDDSRVDNQRLHVQRRELAWRPERHVRAQRAAVLDPRRHAAVEQHGARAEA